MVQANWQNLIKPAKLQVETGHSTARQAAANAAMSHLGRIMISPVTTT